MTDLTLRDASGVVRATFSVAFDPAAAWAPPYSANGPWNTPIAAGAPVNPLSGQWITELAKGPVVTCDPDQYAGPLYRVDTSAAALVPVTFNGAYHEYGNGDQQPLTRSVYGNATTLPIPAGVKPSDGSDGHVIMEDRKAGVEYGFWQFEWQANGSVVATNGYRVPLNGVGSFKDGRSGRGAGTPYGAGLVRSEDIAWDPIAHTANGVINHALAIPAFTPCKTTFLFPAGKTDGQGAAAAPPEGARLRVKASYTPPAGTHPIALLIIAALKRFGGFICDNSGRTKIYVEDRITAVWPFDFTASSLGVPWSAWEFV
jgi:hypothetical protein